MAKFSGLSPVSVYWVAAGADGRRQNISTSVRFFRSMFAARDFVVRLPQHDWQSVRVVFGGRIFRFHDVEQLDLQPVDEAWQSDDPNTSDGTGAALSNETGLPPALRHLAPAELEMRRKFLGLIDEACRDGARPSPRHA